MDNFFTVIAVCQASPKSDRESAYLLVDNWDDWFSYSTMYTLNVRDASGVMHHIGSVKIGQVGMQPGQRRPNNAAPLPHAMARATSAGRPPSQVR